MSITLGSPLFLLALLGVAAALGLLLAGGAIRRRDVRRYEGDGGGPPLVSGVSPRRRRIKAALLLSGVTLAVFAAARPQWGTTSQPVSRQGIDVVFVLDVSSSMAARDVDPERLTRAERESLEIIARLHGERVGLVIFAGTAMQRFPLTTDLDLAGQIISAQRPDDRLVNPGTAVDAGLREALNMLSGGETAARAIVLLSDGEDLTRQDVTAFLDARAHGVTIFSVGIGGTGATIPVRGPSGEVAPKIDSRTNQPVVTRLVEDSLRAAAATTGGSYHAVTPEGGSASGIADEISRLDDTVFDTSEQSRPVERFQILLGAALLLLAVELLLRETPAGPRRRRTMRRMLPLGAVLLLAACAGGVATLNRDGNRLFAGGHYREALSRYREAQVQRPDQLELYYNIGTTLYRLTDYSRALSELRRGVASPDAEFAGRIFYTLGNSYVRLGRLDEAVRAYRDALRANPDDDDARFNLELIQRRLDSITATPEATPSPPGPRSPTPGATGTPVPDGPGTPGPGGAAEPSGSETPAPDGTATPGGQPDEGESTGDQPGREPGSPELPQTGDPSQAGSEPEAAEQRLRELLRALQDPELAPEDALRILDAYEQAQLERDAARQRGSAPFSSGIDDW